MQKDVSNTNTLSDKKVIRKVNTTIEKISNLLKRSDKKLDQTFYDLISALNELYEYEIVKTNSVITMQIKQLLDKVDALLNKKEIIKSEDISLMIINKIDKLKISVDLQDIKDRCPYHEDAISEILWNVQNLEYLDIFLEEYSNSDILCEETHYSIVLALLDANLNLINKYIKRDLTEQGKITYYQNALEKMLHYKKGKFLTSELISVIEIMLNDSKEFYLQEDKKFYRKFKMFSNVFESMLDKDNIVKQDEYITNLFVYPDQLSKIYEKYDELSVDRDSKSLELFSNNYELTFYKEDATDLRAITIDNKDSIVKDDAISIRKLEDNSYIVGLHIADVLSIIPFDHEIIQNLQKFPKSIYTKGGKTDMLPEQVVLNYLTLDENKTRPVTSYYLKISEHGIIFDNIVVKKEQLKVYKNLDYDIAQDILDKKIKDDIAYEKLLLFDELNKKIDPRYSKDPFYELLKKNRKYSTGLDFDTETKAGQIVSNIVFAVNNHVAKLAFNKEIPFIYRVHDFKSTHYELTEQEKIKIDGMNFREKLKYISEVYPSAEFSMTNKGHFGVNLDHYTHISSPLRRAVDVANTIALEKYILELDYLNDIDIEDYLKEISLNTNIYDMNLNRANKLAINTKVKTKKKN